MVEDVTTDGRRIAELLASELTGLELGPLAAVSVVDADSDVEPTPDGAFAYRIEHAGEHVGEVLIQPEAALVVGQTGWPAEAVDASPGLSLADDGTALVVERGAAVKRVVDALRESLDD